MFYNTIKHIRKAWLVKAPSTTDYSLSEANDTLERVQP